MVRILSDDWRGENCTLAHLANASKLSGLRLSAGEPLMSQFPDAVRIVIKTQGEPGDYFVAGPMPVISERIKQVF